MTQDSDNNIKKSETLEFERLKQKYSYEKIILENFLQEKISANFLKIVNGLNRELTNRLKKIEESGNVTTKNLIEKKNIIWLKKELPNITNKTYKELLPLLHKFPSKLQIGVNTEIVKILNTSKNFKDITKKINVKKCVKSGMSLRRFFSNCIAFSRLRQLQLQTLNADDPASVKKALTIEKEFAFIPNHFLLEKRIGGHGITSLFRGVDLESSQTIVIKYIIDTNDAKDKNFEKERQKFESEARAFEKLERYRRSKEEALEKLLEKAQKQITEGRHENNSEKMKEGFELLKKGDQLVCDRYFVRTYRLATGELCKFKITKDDFVSEKGVPVHFMVMEYVDGLSLDALIKEYKQKNSRISLKVVIPILEGVLQALDYCHSEKIVHRDIRPDNILITRNFKVRLTDLGQAKIEDMAHKTLEGALLVGNPLYTAPEGVLKRSTPGETEKLISNKTDHRFDIYSLGCVVYEMITGQPPFTSNEKDPIKWENEILQKKLKNKPVNPSELRNNVRPWLNDIIMRMLEKEPEERFQNAQDTLNVLKSALALQRINDQTQEIPIKDMPIPMSSPISLKRKPVKEISWVKIAISILLLIALAGAGVVYWIYPEYIEKAKNFWQASIYAPKAKKILKDIKKYHSDLKNRVDIQSRKYENFSKRFPLSDGYKQPNKKIKMFLKKLKKKIKEIETIQTEGSKILAENPKKALLWLNQYKNFSEQNKKTTYIIERIERKLENNWNIASTMKNIRAKEKNTRDLARKLRDIMFEAQENLLLIEEKRALLKQFPQKKGFPEIPKNSINRINHLTTQYKNLKHTIEETEKLIIKNEVDGAAKKIEKFSKFSTEHFIEQLKDTDEAFGFLLYTCRQIAKERKYRRFIDINFSYLREELQKLKDEYNKTQNVWKGTPDSVKKAIDYKFIFASSEKNIKELQKNISEIHNLLNKSKDKEAYEIIKNLVNNRSNLAELRSFNSRVLDRVKLFKTTGIQEKQRHEILSLLDIARNNLSKMEVGHKILEKKNKYLQENFPDYLEQKHISFNNRVKKIRDRLKELIFKTENLMSKNQTKEAYLILKRAESNIHKTDRFVTMINKQIIKIQNLADRAKDDVERKMYLVRCKQTLIKLKNFNTLLNNRLKIIESEYSDLNEYYPKDNKFPNIYTKNYIDYVRSKGFPAISNLSIETIEKARKWKSLYNDKIVKSSRLLKSNNVLKTWEELKQFEGKRLGYNIIEDLKKVSEDVHNVKEIAMVKAKSREKVYKAKSLLKELQKRQKDLRKYADALERKMNKLIRYKAKDGFLTVDKRAINIIANARKEIPDLARIIQEGESLLANKDYDEAIEALKYYSVDYDPGVSLLPVIINYLKTCNRVEEKNLAIERDSKLRKERMNVFKENQQELEKMSKWKKSPGEWYDSLKSLMDKYLRIERKLKKEFKEEKLFIIANRININWKKIERFPDVMAELKKLSVDAKQNNKIPEFAKNRNEKLLFKYLKSETIEVNTSTELDKISNSIRSLEKEAYGGLWIEDENLRVLLRNLSTVIRKFDDAYIPVKKVLLSIAY